MSALALIVLLTAAVQAKPSTAAAVASQVRERLAARDFTGAGRILGQQAPRFRGDTGLAALAVECLSHSDGGLVTCALDALGELRVESTIPSLKAAIARWSRETEKDEGARRVMHVGAAIRALGDIRSEKAVPILAQLGPDVHVRAPAVSALATIRGAKAVEVLLRWMEAGGEMEKPISIELARMTGEPERDATGWRAWWKENGELHRFADERLDWTGLKEVRARVDGTFKLSRSEHFLVASDTDATPILSKLEAVHDAMRKEFDFQEWHALLVVYLFKDKPGLRAFAVKERGEKDADRAGFASPAGYVALFDGVHNDYVLPHETAHLILWRCLRVGGPLWLHEGVAEHVAVETRGARAEAAAEVKALVAGEKAGPLAKLFEEQESLPDEGYVQAYGLVRFLRERHGSKLFSKRLAQLRDGRTATADLLRLYGYATIEALEKAWKEHARK